MSDSVPSGAAAYVQAIPIYLRSDTAVADFFRDYSDELDAITGCFITILLSKTVVLNDTSEIVDVIDAPTKSRFPGLQISDLPCLWIEDDRGGSTIVKLPHAPEDIKQTLRFLAEAARKTKDAPKLADLIRTKSSSDIVERSSFLTTLLEGVQVSKQTERLIALIFGVVFVAAILVIAIFIPNPSAFQYTIFRIVLALAAGGFVSMTPGFIDVQVGTGIRAGGALAVFVVVFFFAPAALQALK